MEADSGEEVLYKLVSEEGVFKPGLEKRVLSLGLWEKGQRSRDWEGGGILSTPTLTMTSAEFPQRPHS